MNRIYDCATKFWMELSRRKTVRTALAYLFLLVTFIGPASDILGGLGAPEWILRGTIFAMFGAFPLVLIFSWVFDITAHGIERTSAVAPEEPDYDLQQNKNSGTSETRHVADHREEHQWESGNVTHLHCTFLVMQAPDKSESPIIDAIEFDGEATADDKRQAEKLYNDIKPLLRSANRNVI